MSNESEPDYVTVEETEYEIVTLKDGARAVRGSYEGIKQQVELAAKERPTKKNMAHIKWLISVGINRVYSGEFEELRENVPHKCRAYNEMRKKREALRNAAP